MSRGSGEAVDASPAGGGRSERAGRRTLRALARRHGWLVTIAVAYLYVFPYFPRIQSANELPRVYLAQAIALDHTFTIDRGVARWGATADVSPAAGHQFSNKAPGSSMLAAPPYLVVASVAGEPGLASAMWIARVFGGIVPALLFLALVYRFLARYTPDPVVRQLVCLAYGLGSMAMTYAVLFYSHQLAAACVASAWILGLEAAAGTRRLRAFAIAGALAGCAPLVDYQAAFAGVPVAIHVACALRGRSPREIARACGLAVAGAAFPIAVLLAYHDVCFGSPWRTGYDASVTFAHHHQAGFLGLTTLRWEAFWGSFFRLDNGLFTLAPWLLLALPGIVVLGRRARGAALVAAAVLAIYVLFVSAINFWRGGWGVGPRYITAMLPFLLPPIAVVIAAVHARSRLAVGALAGLVGTGVVIYVLSTVTFPYWPDSIAHPLYDVTFRLLGEDLAAPSLGSVLGIPGILGVAPVIALVAAVVGVTIVRLAGGRGLAVAALVTTSLLVAYGWFPHGGAAVDRPYGFVRGAVLDAAR